MLPPPPPNYVHAVIGGNLVLYNRGNFQVADVFHFDATFQYAPRRSTLVLRFWRTGWGF